MHKNSLQAHVAVLCTNLFFAFNFSLIKFISPSVIKPFALNILRVGGSLVLFWLMWTMGKTKAPIRKEHWWRFFLCALTGVAINQMFFIKGLTYTSAIHASLLILLTPLLITVFAFWVLKEKVTLAKSAGLSMGIGGSVLLILSKEQAAGAPDYLLGDLLIVINAMAYTVYFIIVKPLMLVYPPLHVLRWVFTLGFLMILPFGWSEFTEISWVSMHMSHYLSLGFIVTGGTALAYLFNIYAIHRLGAGIAGSYIYTQPVFAALIAILFFGESLTVEKITAGFLIFTGIFLVSYRKNLFNSRLGVIEE